MVSLIPDGLVVLETKEAVRALRADTRSRGLTLGFVPTMGYLHDGHLSLIRVARAQSDVVLMSLFVNPTQFGAGEDLDAYPRDIEGDLRKARAAGADVVFIPSNQEMYAPESETVVQVGPLADELCGASRPTHFAGVCTVVAKLFNITGCDLAVFGEKDYQQLAIIRRMVQDLDIPVQVIGAPIVREVDGLAMSSRNAYLSDTERRDALALNQGLKGAAQAWQTGERSAAALGDIVRGRIAEVVGARVDYVQVVDADTLRPVEEMCSRGTLVAVAVYFGETRLIDNMVLGD